jgi:hypothetical protein
VALSTVAPSAEYRSYVGVEQDKVTLDCTINQFMKVGEIGQVRVEDNLVATTVSIDCKAFILLLVYAEYSARPQIMYRPQDVAVPIFSQFRR